jgi:NADH-quinone oxidoreductase subunit J
MPLVSLVPLGHVPILAVTITDATVFAVSALVIVAGAIGVIAARNPVHSALMLIMTLFGIAVLFVEQSADFLAVVQVIVYAGAIVVLFLFVIMLLGVDRLEALQRDPLPGQRPLALIIGAAGLSLLLFLAGIHWVTGAHSLAGPAGGPGSNVEKLARSLFTTYLLPFEVTSVLLVIAVVGAVVLSRRPAKELEPPEDEHEPAGRAGGRPR